MKKWPYFAFVLWVLFSPVLAFALTTHFDSCSQFDTIQSTVSCDDSSGTAVITFASAAGHGAYENLTNALGNIYPPGSYTVTGNIDSISTSEIRISILDETGTPIDGVQFFDTAGAFTSVPIVLTGGTTANGFAVEEDYSSATDAIVSHLCITDSGGCGSPPPPPATSTEATSTVDRAQANLTSATWLYFAAMFGMLWLLRKQ